MRTGRGVGNIWRCVIAATVVSGCAFDSDAGSELNSDDPLDNVEVIRQASTAPTPQKVFAMGNSIYVVTRDSELMWYGDVFQNGTPGWAANSGLNVIGEGWTTTSARLAFSGGNGIIYVVDSAGYLRWYRDTNQNGAWSWAANSGNIIGSGWNTFEKAFADQSGTIYAIDYSGNLRWYKDVARDGTPGWGAGSGGLIGTGWQSMRWQMADANGVIYAVDNAGVLRWYRDANKNGTWGWAANSGNQIGSGWQNMVHAFGAGGGVLYAVEPTGALRYYRDVNNSGFPGWGAGSGNIIGSGWNSISYRPPLSAFGHGSLKVNNRSATGIRPTLVVLAQYSDQPAFTRSNAYFEQVHFGTPSSPPFTTPANPASLSQYLNENSNARFTISKAGLVGPVAMGTLASAGATPEARVKSILTKASASGFNFASYDSNGDGVVSQDELLLVTVENIPGLLPANRANATPLTLNGKQIAMRSAMTGDTTSFDSIAHEFMHSIGADDLYYGGCLSQSVTVMSCTDFNNALQNPRHLDPWHKFRLGWIDPVVQRITTSGSAVVSLSTWSTPDGASLFWSRARGTNEYFLVEKRAQAQTYDSGVLDTGVAIWHVNASNAGVVALGAPSLSFGGSSLWKASNTTPTLTWNNGSSTGSSFSFSASGANYQVSW